MGENEDPIVEPVTEVHADLTGDTAEAPEAATEGVKEEPSVEDPASDHPENAGETPEPEKAPEPEVPVEPIEPDPTPDPEPDPEPADEGPETVTFRCERWAGVRLHGTSVKFEDHYFTTSDDGEITRLDGWEHAERVS